MARGPARDVSHISFHSLPSCLLVGFHEQRNVGNVWHYHSEFHEWKHTDAICAEVAALGQWRLASSVWRRARLDKRLASASRLDALLSRCWKGYTQVAKGEQNVGQPQERQLGTDDHSSQCRV